MKILILSDRYLRGGMETHIENYIKGMNNTQFYIGTSDQTGYLNLFTKQKNVNLSRGSIHDVLSTLQGFVYEENIQAIHAHTPTAYLVAAIIGYRLHIPYIYTIHGPGTLNDVESWLPRDVWGELLRYAHQVYVVSKEVKDKLAYREESQITYLPNCIDVNTFTAQEHEKVKGRWAIVSRLHFDKIGGIENALLMMKETSIQEVFIYGSGNAVDYLKEKIRQYHIMYPIIFRGHQEELNEVIEKDRCEGIMAMGRGALEGLAKNYPVFLLGYEGVKGLITEENIEEASYTNFSGRNDPVIPQVVFQKQLEEMRRQPKKFQLRRIIEAKYNMVNAVQQYEEVLIRPYREVNLKALNDELLEAWEWEFQDKCPIKG